MTTVEIKADKVVAACKHQLIEAEAKLEQAAKERPKEMYSAFYHTEHLFSLRVNINWIKSMIAAANASEGVVTMSVEDVARIKEWL